MALFGQPDTIAPLAIARHQHFGTGTKVTRRLLGQKSIGLLTVFVGFPRKLLIPELTHG